MRRSDRIEVKNTTLSSIEGGAGTRCSVLGAPVGGGRKSLFLFRRRAERGAVRRRAWDASREVFRKVPNGALEGRNETRLGCLAEGSSYVLDMFLGGLSSVG